MSAEQHKPENKVEGCVSQVGSGRVQLGSSRGGNWGLRAEQGLLGRCVVGGGTTVPSSVWRQAGVGV